MLTNPLQVVVNDLKMEQDSLSRLLEQRHASRTGVAHLLSTMDSTRASSSPAQRKLIRFGALFNLLDEKIDLLEDLDLNIQLAISDDVMESEILSSTQHLNELLKQKSSFKAYYDGLKLLLDVTDEAAPVTSAGSRRIQPSTSLPDPKPLSTLKSKAPPSSTLSASQPSTTPFDDAIVAVIGPRNVSTLDVSTLIHPAILNPASDSTHGCVDESSSTRLNAAEDSVSSDSSLPEVILPSDEGFQHSSSIAHISRTTDLSVNNNGNHPSIPNLPTERAADSSPLLDVLKPISRFISYENHPNNPEFPTERAADSSPLTISSKPIGHFNVYNNHPADSIHTDHVLQVRAHQLALLTTLVGSPSLKYDPAAQRCHPYRNPAIRPAKPPPWLLGT